MSQAVRIIASDKQIGTSGVGYEWRKYNNERIEYWGWYNYNITKKTAWGNVYYSNTLGNTAFPTNLYHHAPYCVVSPGWGGLDGWITNPRDLTATHLPYFYHVTIGNSTGYSINCSFHCYG